jgi:hypothetical protein
MYIAANEHDVGAASTLTATKAERIEAREMRDVTNVVAGVVDGL